MKALRTGLLALLALVLLALGAAVFLIATFDANRHKDSLVELVRERSGRELAIGGDIALSVFPRLALTAADLSLTDPDGKTPFAAIEQVELAVQVLPLFRGAVQVERVRVIRPQLSYRRDAQGRSNVDDLLGAAAAGTAEERAPGGAGSSGPGRSDDETGGGDGAGGEFALDIDGVELVDARVAVDDAKGGIKGEVRGLSLELGRLVSGTSAPFALAADFAFEQPALRGRLETGGEMLVEAQRLAVRGLTLDLALTPAQTAALRLSLAGDLEHALDTGNTRAQFKGRFDDSALEGSVDTAQGQPLKFALKLDRLDVDRYTAGPSAAPQPVKDAPSTAPVAAGEGGKAAGAQGRARGDAQPVDLSFAAGAPLDGRLEVGELRAAGLTLNEVSARLTGDGRSLSVAPLAARGYGGTMKGELRVDAAGQRVRVQQSFADIQVGPLLRDLAGKDTLEGRGSLAFDVDTRGRTVGELKRALAGKAELALRDGAIKGFNVGQILRDGQALLSGQRDESYQFRRTEQTDFSALDASFRIAGGVARNDDLALLSPLLRVGGEGLIDIGGNRIDYTLRTSVVATAEGQGGAGLEKLRGLTVPVRITGPLEAPAPQVLWSAVVGDAARRALAERLQEKLDEKRGEGGDGGSAPATPEDALKEELGRRLQDLLR